MNRNFSILLAFLALIGAMLACSGGQLSLENPRMAHDEPGTQVTTTYSPNDIFYVVADLKNATKGTVVEAKWYAVNADGVTPGPISTDQPSVLTIQDDYFTGYVSFNLSSNTQWPSGEYKAELYLNNALAHSVNFTVQ